MWLIITVHYIVVTFGYDTYMCSVSTCMYMYLLGNSHPYFNHNYHTHTHVCYLTQATLSVTLHKSSRPLADLGPLMSPKLLPLLVCDPLFMTKLAIIACGGVVKEGERPLEAADLLSKRVVTQVLDLLCWIACLHCNTPNRCNINICTHVWDTIENLSTLESVPLHVC